MAVKGFYSYLNVSTGSAQTRIPLLSISRSTVDLILAGYQEAIKMRAN